MLRFLVLALLVFPLHAHAVPMFVPLGDLPGGGFQSQAGGVSADGSTVVGAGLTDTGYEAFRWTSGDGMMGLGYLPGHSQSDAAAVSADGSTVVGGSSPSEGSWEASVWTSGGGAVGLGFLPGGFSSFAYGVSADGSTVVGESITDTGYEAFRWTTGEGMVGLGYLPGYSESSALGVSADGSTVVGGSLSYEADLVQEATMWTSVGGAVGLGFLPGCCLYSVYSFATGVSADGSVVVGDADNGLGYEAFRWTSGGGMLGLGDLPGGIFSSSAMGVSADGSTVVGVSAIGFGEEGEAAFIWDATHGMRPVDEVLTGLGVDLTGWTLRQARDISADGRVIVGVGTNPSGQTEAWLAVLPEPSTAWLLALGLVGLAGWRRRFV